MCGRTELSEEEQKELLTSQRKVLFKLGVTPQVLAEISRENELRKQHHEVERLLVCVCVCVHVCVCVCMRV